MSLFIGIVSYPVALILALCALFLIHHVRTYPCDLVDQSRKLDPTKETTGPGLGQAVLDEDGGTYLT